MFRLILGGFSIVPVLVLLMLAFALCIVAPLIGIPLATVLVVVGVKSFKQGWQNGKEKAARASATAR